jgi:hypothetical protein
LVQVLPQAAKPLGVERAIIGRSGARVLLFNDRVEKYGDARVVEQGKYAVDLGPNVCPAVRHVTENGYTMERCLHVFDYPKPIRELGPATERADEVMKKARKILDFHVWGRTYKGLGAATSRISQAFWYFNLIPTLNQDLVAWATRVKVNFDGRDCPPTYVHGDPTLENMLTRKDGSIAIGDPLPPQPKLPLSWHVDVGKMLQSMIGFEGISFPADRWVECIGSDNEIDIDACWFFCALAFHRIIPYAPDVDFLTRVVNFRENVVRNHYRPT